jgi:hypothetical protein
VIDGFLFDLMVAGHAALSWHAPLEAPVAVVAINRTSLQAPRFATEPRALFARYWGQLLNALLDAGAQVVAFDLIFDWSADGMLPDHDRSFREALGNHADHVVLAQSHDLGLAPSFFNAVYAGSTGDATDAAARIEDAKARDDAAGRCGFSVKIALNTGLAIVGNVGASDRVNYTALGDAVNIASRLEGVSADYGCPIVIGPATAASVRESFLILKLDRILVPGCPEPIEIYRPLIGADKATPAQRDMVCAYGLALAHYHAGRFADAASAWLAMTNQPAAGPTGPHTIMAARAIKLAGGPPPHWDGIWVRTTK